MLAKGLYYPNRCPPSSRDLPGLHTNPLAGADTTVDPMTRSSMFLFLCLYANEIGAIEFQPHVPAIYIIHIRDIRSLEAVVSTMETQIIAARCAHHPHRRGNNRAPTVAQADSMAPARGPIVVAWTRPTESAREGRDPPSDWMGMDSTTSPASLPRCL